MNDTKLKLLVPVHIDALVINDNSSTWKDLSLNIDNLSTDNYGDTKGLGYYLNKDVQQAGGNNFHKKGIHLHWVLPASLRHGLHNAQTNSLDFPLVPNRWLVVRTDAQLQINTWMVESDFIDGTANSNFNWIKQQTGVNNSVSGIEPIKIGRAMPLADWTEQKTDKLFLTVTAPGNPDFGASYMHSKNVFGFYDDMHGAAAGAKFSYSVYGWFSDVNANPFAWLNTKTAFLQKMNELSWTLSGIDSLTDDKVPGDVICHANISSVLWAEKTTTTVPSISDIKLGIGNSSSEALASLLPSRITGDMMAMPEKLLAAFQYKLLSDNGLEDNPLKLLKTQMHHRSFNPTKGGTYWVVEQAEKNELPDNNDKTSETSAPFATIVSSLLNDLNKSQHNYDILLSELKSSQAHLYALKHKSLYARTLDAPLQDFNGADQQKIIGQITSDTDSYKKNITNLIKSVSTLKRKTSPSVAENQWPTGWTGEIVTNYTNLKNALLDPQYKMQDFIVKEVPMPVFYEPLEPAVVIDGLKPSAKYLSKTNISCRTVEQLIMSVKINYNNGDFTYGIPDIIEQGIVHSIGTLFAKLPTAINGLVKESILLDPLYAAFVPKYVISQGNPLSIIEADQLTNEVASFLLDFSNPANASHFINANKTQAVLPEQFSAMQWHQPWTPLYLEWEVDWKSTYDTLPNNAAMEKWDYGTGDNNIDYKPATQVPPTKATEYYGRTILSDTMVDKVAGLNKKLGKDLFQDLLPMSQTLSGLNSQLMMRNHGIQLPILEADLSPNTEYFDMIGNEHAWSPTPNISAFQPLRAGFFQLAMLRVIDSFGQVLEIMNVNDKDGNPVSPSVENRKFTHSAGLNISSLDKKAFFTMPPRILQPSRLRFDWISGNDTKRVTDSDPATSPVCGWLLYNKMDKSISVYDGDGIEIGELKNINNAIQLETPTGSPVAVSIYNATLNNIVNFARTDTTTFNELISRVDAVNKKVQSKVSRQGLTMTLPVGFPIAVATARCTLELKGSPALNQNWDPAADKLDFKSTKFQACIGNDTSKMDGLVGYFLSNDYKKMHHPFQATEVDNTNLDLQIDKVVQLTVLMDPRMAVNISSGILPSAKYELPNHVTAQPLKNINLRFMAAPIITPVSAVKIPLMESQDITWNWISNAKLNGETTVSQIVPDSNTKDILKFEPLHAIEGWLKINSKPVG